MRELIVCSDENDNIIWILFTMYKDTRLLFNVPSEKPTTRNDAQMPTNSIRSMETKTSAAFRFLLAYLESYARFLFDYVQWSFLFVFSFGFVCVFALTFYDCVACCLLRRWIWHLRTCQIITIVNEPEMSSKIQKKFYLHVILLETPHTEQNTNTNFFSAMLAKLFQCIHKLLQFGDAIFNNFVACNNFLCILKPSGNIFMFFKVNAKSF